MKQIDTITLVELTKMAERMYGNFVKGVADVQRGVIALDAELHVDLEQFLLEHGSVQTDLWGFNLYPSKFDTPEFIEFDSMINIRPSQHTMTRGIEDEAVRQTIAKLVAQKVRA